MKKEFIFILTAFACLILSGCASVQTFEQADSYKSQIRKFAVLPLVVGDEDGRVDTLGKKEITEFVDFFNQEFYDRLSERVSLVNDIELLLPGRDYDKDVLFDADYDEILKLIGADALFEVKLTAYNEVDPGAKIGQTFLGIVTSVLFGGYVMEKNVATYEMHYYYLGIEDVERKLTISPYGYSSIEMQREQYIDDFIAYIDENIPLSTDYFESY